MIHLIAEFLFWSGRLESIVFLMFLVHLLTIWLLRSNPLARLFTAVWLLIYLGVSFTLFEYLIVTPAVEGTGYLMAHLYEGRWTDSEALASVLLRWQNVLLPIYLPWLAVWMGGLLSILFFAALRHEIVTGTK